MNPISFSGKIPIGTCKIHDKTTKEYIPAICYKYDCMDESDIEDFKNCQNKSGGVPFNIQIKNSIKDKLKNPDANKFHHIYTLETKNGLIANAHLEETENEVRIIQLGAKKKTYGLAGRSLVAQMGADILKDKPNCMLVAYAPVPDAFPFYTGNCKFKFDKNYTLGIDKKGIDDLCNELLV